MVFVWLENKWLIILMAPTRGTSWYTSRELRISLCLWKLLQTGIGLNLNLELMNLKYKNCKHQLITRQECSKCFITYKKKQHFSSKQSQHLWAYFFVQLGNVSVFEPIKRCPMNVKLFFFHLLLFSQLLQCGVTEDNRSPKYKCSRCLLNDRKLRKKKTYQQIVSIPFSSYASFTQSSIQGGLDVYFSVLI